MLFVQIATAFLLYQGMRKWFNIKNGGVMQLFAEMLAVIPPALGLFLAIVSQCWIYPVLMGVLGTLMLALINNKWIPIRG